MGKRKMTSISFFFFSFFPPNQKKKKNQTIFLLSFLLSDFLHPFSNPCFNNTIPSESEKMSMLVYPLYDYLCSFFQGGSTVFDVEVGSTFSRACLEMNDKVFNESFQAALADKEEGLKMFSSKDKYLNWTPLHYACYAGYKHGMRMLIQLESVNINIIDCKFHTPLYIAYEMRHSQLVVELINHRAIDLTAGGIHNVLGLMVKNDDGKMVDVLLAKWPETLEGLKALRGIMVVEEQEGGGDITADIQTYAVNKELFDISEAVLHRCVSIEKKLSEEKKLGKKSMRQQHSEMTPPGLGSKI